MTVTSQVPDSPRVDPPPNVAGVPAAESRGSRRPEAWGPVALCLAGILGLALLLRTVHVSDISLNFDECCSWKISQFPWSEMIDAVSRDAHPPVYYAMMKGVGGLGVHGTAGVRAVSIVWGIATIGVAFWFVRTALGDLPESSSVRSAGLRNIAALLAALLVTVSALHVEMSLQARPYTWGTFLTLLAGGLLLRATRPAGHVWDWAGFAVAATLLSLTHYYGLFTVAAFFLFGAGEALREFWQTGWGSTTKRLLTGLVLSAWGVQLAWAFWWPVFAFQRSRSTPQLWMRPLDWNELCVNCWQALAGGTSSAVPAAWSWLGVGVWIGTVLTLWWMGGRAGRLVALGAGFPLAATVVYGLTVRNILGAKYLIFAQVFLLVGWSLLAARLRWSSARIGFATVVLAWSGYWCWKYADQREYLASFPGVQGAAAYLEQARGPDDPVLVGSPFVSTIVQQYVARPETVFVRYAGDHRRDILGGPPLRDIEYRDLDRHWGPAADRVWTIDVYEMFGPNGRFEVRPPDGWILARQEEFREANGIACVMAVREYQRQPQSAATATVRATD